MAISICESCGRQVPGAPRQVAAGGGTYCPSCAKERSRRERTVQDVVAEDRSDGYFYFTCGRCGTSMRVPFFVQGEEVSCIGRRCGELLRLSTAEYRRDARRLASEERRELIQVREEQGVHCPDQIVVLGRPQSGKTVYLAVLYRALWRSTGDLSGIATSHASHETLIEHYHSMTHGQWPEGGQGTLQIRRHDLALTYRKQRFRLSTMDYPGEVYRKVFYEKRIDTPECEELFHQVDAALAVLLLLDPEQAMREERDILDLEFSCVQVVEHLRERGLQDNLVIILTKRDQNAALVARHGGPAEFVRRFLPRLAEAVPGVRVTSLTAMPEARDGKGVVRLNADDQTIPAPREASLVDVVTPLRWVLDAVGPDHLRFLDEMDRRIVGGAVDPFTRDRHHGGAADGTGGDDLPGGAAVAR